MFGFGGGGRKRGGGPCGPGGGPPPFAHFMHRFGGGWGSGAILQDLDLTDEQLERAAELKLEGVGQFMQLKLSLGQLIKQIMRELSKEQIDRAKVKEIGKQIQEQKNRAGDAFLDRIIDFAEVLTPEQRKKLRMKAIRRFLGVDTPRHEHDE